MELLDKHKIGYRFGLIGTVLGFIGIAISFFWHYSIEPVSFMNIWISNLGAGPFSTHGIPTPYPGSNILFNLSLFICSILIWVFGVSIYRSRKTVDKKNNIFALLGLIFGSIHLAGMMLVSVFDMNMGTYNHVIGALLMFNGLFGEVLFYSIMFYREGKRWKGQIVFGIIATILFVVFYIISYLCGINFGLSVSTLTFDEVVLFMSSMLPSVTPVRLMEWVALPLMFLWIMISAGYVGIDFNMNYKGKKSVIWNLLVKYIRIE